MHLVYKTTNLVNSKIYIGVHKNKTGENDNYLGSGKLLKQALDKYGIENFKRETLFEFQEEKDAYLKESEIVNEEFIRRKDNYNISVGGQGGVGNLPMSEKNKKLMSIRMKGREISEEHKKKISKKTKGKIFTEETKKKISISKTGKRRGPLSEEWKRKLSESSKGRKFSESHLEKLKTRKKKVECPYCQKEGGANVMHRWHFENCKSLR